MRNVLTVAAVIGVLLATSAAANADSYIFTQIDVPGANQTIARGINNAGQIVGTFFDRTGNHGFPLFGGTFTQIDVPGADTGSTSVFSVMSRKHHGHFAGCSRM